MEVDAAQSTVVSHVEGSEGKAGMAGGAVRCKLVLGVSRYGSHSFSIGTPSGIGSILIGSDERFRIVDVDRVAGIDCAAIQFVPRARLLR